MPIISAVICTYKRADYLRQALRSLCEQTLARSEFEVLVVDNAVEDETEQVVKEFERIGLPVRYVPESRVGLSRARNTGYEAAHGRYVAYLDDDARPDDCWLKSLVAAFERTSAAAIGGRVWLDWQGERPAWVPDDQLSLFTFVDHGDEARALQHHEYLVGANLALDRETLITIGGFATNLGRQGAVLLSGEEAKVLNQLRHRGLTIYYEPAALVWHSVHPSRKRPSWLLRRMFWDGASQPLLDQLHDANSRTIIFRATLRDLRQCLRWLLSAAVATLSGQKTLAFESLLGLSQRAGRVRTELRMLAIPN
jgi:glycosyltransferase involved in cell wall biosynthesis